MSGNIGESPDAINPSDALALSAQQQASRAALDSVMPQIESVMQRNITRRGIGMLGAILVGRAALDTIETPIMNHHYGTRPTTVDIHPESACDPNPYNSALLTSPGWGSPNGVSIVRQYRSHHIYPSNFAMGSFWYEPKGVNEYTIKKEGRIFAERTHAKTMITHGDSLGWIMSLIAAQGAGVHLDMTSGNDSPMGIDDARHSWLARAIAWADELRLYRGGLIGKAATCFLDEVTNDGLYSQVRPPDRTTRQFLRDVYDAAINTWHGGDPRMAASQLVILENADMMGRRHDFKRRGIINRDTTAILCKTDNASTDKTVLDNQLPPEWQDFYDYFGIKLIVSGYEAPGHAKTGPALQAAGPHMKQVLADAGIIKVKDV